MDNPQLIDEPDKITIVLNKQWLSNNNFFVLSKHLDSIGYEIESSYDFNNEYILNNKMKDLWKKLNEKK